MQASTTRTRPAVADWLAYVLSVLPGLVLALLAVGGLISTELALILFVPSFIGLNLAHMAATWGRAYADDERWRSAWIERIAIPALLVVGSISFDSIGFGALLLAAQYWLSIHHAGMQNYGLLRASQRRAGRLLGARGLRLDQAACVGLPIAALTYRARAVCREYDGIVLPVPPAWLVALLVVVGGAALLAYLVREALAAWRKQPVDALGVALVVATNLTWSGLIVFISHPALPLYALASGHYIQQLYFVWRFESQCDGFTRLPSGVRRWLAPPSRLGYLVGLAIAGALVVSLLTLLTLGVRGVAATLGLAPQASLIPPWLAAMIGVNLSHYWLEHRIWRKPAAASQLHAHDAHAGHRPERPAIA